MSTASRPARRHFVFGAATACALAACSTAPPAPAFPTLTYGHKGVLRFAAERVEIVSTYVPPMRRPNIDHELPVMPLETLQRWARERLLAAGGAQRYLRFIVREASLIESELPRTTGVRGAFTSDQTERYDLVLSAALELRQSNGGLVEAAGEARTARFRTVKDNISLAERERAWHQLIEQGMNDLDAELERQIRSHFAMFMV